VNVKQIKLFVFDMEEKLVATLENKDANSCPVKECRIKEALNGAFTLEFEIENDHEDLDKIKEKYFVAVKDVDGKDQLFIIQEIEDSHEDEKNKRIFCDHASIELADEIIEELLIDRKNSSLAFESIMFGSKWTIGTLEATVDVHDLTARIKSRREVIETFLNRWGVEISYEVVLGARDILTRKINIEIERGSDIGKRLEYGHNMQSIRRTINADFVKTALYGIGKEIQAENATENEAVKDDEESAIVEEKKRYVDFGGLEWSTVSEIDVNTGFEKVTKNLLPSYQTKPTKTTDLNPWTWGGDYRVSIVSDAPTLEGITKSYQIKQVEENSDFMSINTAKKKLPVTTGTKYTFSFYVKANKNCSIKLWLEFYNAKGTHYKPITGEQRIFSNTISVTANVWTRISLEKIAPTHAKLAMISADYLNPNINDWMKVTAFNATIDTLVPFVERVKTGGQPFDKPKGQKWIGDETARLTWGRYNKTTGLREHIYGIYKNNDIEDPSELLLDTKAQLEAYKNPQITYEVSEIALGEILGLSTLKTRIGDKTTVIDRDLNIQIQARAIERDSDLIDESNSEIKFGDFQQLLSLQQIKDRENLEARLEQETNPPFPQTTLEEGRPIYTDWLEGEINALKNEVIAGSGTVTITETNGILIETVDKTKALRLLGGMLALADERDEITGEYNWRSFGTGEGFLADLVQTGFLKFDRAKGGTLTLGGEIIAYDENGKPIYENGNLVVYGSEIEADGRPIVVSLSGDQGGFDKLSIGELTNIKGTNIVTSTFQTFAPENRDANDNIVFYVDPIDGLDTNVGTSDAPKKNIQACIDLLPKFIDVNVYIYVLPTLVNDTEILIEGIVGHGFINIELWNVGLNTRYIRDWVNGSTANTGDHWVEVRGIKNADGAIVHAGGTTYPERINLLRSDTMANINANGLNIQRASDGDVTYNLYASATWDTTSTICDIYLGGVYDCKFIDVFHYWIDGRTYYGTKTQISADGGTGRWYTIFDSSRQGTYAETASGKRHDLKHFILNGRVKVNTCMVNVRVFDAYVNGEEVGNPTIDAHHSNYVEIRRSIVFGDPTYDYAVYANGSNVRILDSEVNTAEVAGLISAYGGRLEVVNVKGSGFPYALYAHSTGIVAGSGMSPVGTTAQKLIETGGTMNATWTATSGDYLKAPVTTKTTTWTANDTQSLYGTNWTLSSYIYQGKRPTETTAWYGVMFFNTRDFSALAGRTIKSVRLKLQRTNNTGDNTARKPKIYYNMQTSASGTMQTLLGGHVSSVSFTWGQEKWVTLPTSYGDAFKNGTAKSLVLWVGTSEADYMRFEARATLEITHSG
jgi:phage minor structural protein